MQLLGDAEFPFERETLVTRPAGRAAGRSRRVPVARRPSPAALLLAAVGWLAWGWFRDSALVQVRHVQIERLATADAPRDPARAEEAGDAA